VSRITRSAFPAPNLRVALSAAGLDIWRRLRQGMFDSYRPELHYMRGPGPKWREKHADVASVFPGLASPIG
jgi:hypothetical protein